jgi:transposase
MGSPGPQKINRYGVEFKLKAVAMSNQPGVLVKDVAESLCIHPFMLSKWRKQVRDGELVGKTPVLESAAVAELQRLREVEQQFKRLQMEHDLLKKAIRFASERRAKSLPSSRQTGKRTLCR